MAEQTATKSKLKRPPKVKATKKPAAAPIFKYDASVMDAAGKKSKKRVSSVGRSRARLELTAAGFQVLEIHEVKHWWDIEIGKPVSQQVLLQVTRQLAAFTAAGVPLLEALRLLANAVNHKRMKATLLAIAEDVRDGDTLPQAARSHPQVFPEYYLSILDASERSGDLRTTFETLASYLERDLASSRAVKSALYYPAILLVMAVVAVVVLSTTVLPRFEQFFSSLGAELPLATRILLSVSRFMGDWWWAVLLGFAWLVVMLIIFRNAKTGRLVTDRFLLRLPIFGHLIEIIVLERFARVLGSLSAAGVPLPDGLRLASGVMGNQAYNLAVQQTREGVVAGLGLSDPMEATKRFPAEIVEIIRVGEQTGRLVEQLDHSATYYAKEVDYRLKNLTTLIEPVVLLIVGGGVGFVAIALVSAMYGIYSSVNVG